jgi:hypothetical protein
VTTLTHTLRVAGTRKQLTYIAIAALVALLVTAAIVLPLTLTGSSSSRPAAVARPTAHSVPLIQYRGNGAAPATSESAVTQAGQSNVTYLRRSRVQIPAQVQDPGRPSVLRAEHSRNGMIPNWR